VLARQPGLQGRQGEVRMGLDVGRQGGLLAGIQLARPVAAPRAGAHLALLIVKHRGNRHRGDAALARDILNRRHKSWILKES